jgi:hypothetical protein
VLRQIGPGLVLVPLKTHRHDSILPFYSLGAKRDLPGPVPFAFRVTAGGCSLCGRYGLAGKLIGEDSARRPRPCVAVCRHIEGERKPILTHPRSSNEWAVFGLRKSTHR